VTIEESARTMPGNVRFPADYGFVPSTESDDGSVMWIDLNNDGDFLDAGEEIPDTITFGAAHPLTGGLSPEGEKQRRGYELWKDLVNEQGGSQVGDQHSRRE
jgi:ABC-type branched-subunit amino acid transport system substrate-binding protein